jgi:hypothetical protein
MTWMQIGSYQNGTTNIRTSLWRTDVGGGKAGATTITATLGAAERDTVITALELVGVTGIGVNTQDASTTANPTIAITTQDANNYVIAMLGARGGTLPTTLTGTLDLAQSSEGTSQVSGGLVSNTAASASSVTCAETLAAATWTVVAIELRAGIPATVALTGVTATAARGTVSPTISGFVALTGVTATATRGTVSPTTSGVVALTGVTATVTRGSVSPTGAIPAPPTVFALLVAGGGGGGKGSTVARGAAGGGGGGMRPGSRTVAPGTTLTVVVGAGGAAATVSTGTGVKGGDSTVTGLTTAVGGGGGGNADGGTGSGTTGGSGGGAGDNNGNGIAGAAGTGGQGNAGGNNGNSGGTGGSGGGGGGAGGIGTNGAIAGGTRAAGGAGSASSISGAAVTYAAGGSGGEWGAPGTAGTAGAANTGNGGGGGGGNSGWAGAAGGSGIVILSYPTGALSATGGTITTAGGNTIHTFTASGLFIAAPDFAADATVTFAATAALRTTALLAADAPLGVTATATLRSGVSLRADATLAVTATAGIALGTDVTVTIGGTDKTAVLVVGSVTAEDGADAAARRCTFQTRYRPTENAEVVLTLGGSRFFGGTVVSVEQLVQEKETNLAWRVTCESYGYLLKRRFPIGRAVNVSLTAFITTLISTSASGFTVAGVVGGLPSITIDYDGTEDLPAVLTRACHLAGAHWTFTNNTRDISAYLTDTANQPDAISDTNTKIQNLTRVGDVRPLRSRDYVRGKATSAALNGASLPAGGTRIPVQDCSYWDSSGSAWLAVERGAYSSRFTALDGAGKTTASKVVGPLQSPGMVFPILIPSGGHVVGTVTYRTAFVLGDRGESELSAPSASVFGTQVAMPGLVLGFTYGGGGSMAPSNYAYQVTFVTATGETESPGNVIATMSAGQSSVGVNTIPIASDTRVIGRNIYRSIAGDTPSGRPRFLCKSIPDNVTTSFTDTIADISLGQPLPNVNTTGDSARLIGIPTGPGGTTSRRLYRVNASGSTYLFLATIGDNVTTTWIDTKAAADLGAEAPQFSAVSTLAGSTSLGVRDAAQFTTAGWVNLGGQLVSYTGRTAASGLAYLTGIPPSGIGAIAADIGAGTNATAVPHLTLASGTTYAVNDGDPIRPYVQRDNASAQAAVAAVEGGDGIHDFVITDESLTTTAQMTAVGDADLALFASTVVTVTYQTRDPKTKAGKSVVINRTSQGWSGTFVIQRVSITEIGVGSRLLPLYTVTASSVNLTMEDILQRVLRAP